MVVGKAKGCIVIYLVSSEESLIPFPHLALQIVIVIFMHAIPY